MRKTTKTLSKLPKNYLQRAEVDMRLRILSIAETRMVVLEVMGSLQCWSGAKDI